MESSSDDDREPIDDSDRERAGVSARERAGDDSAQEGTDSEETRAREVEVPLHVYKVVTVFSTLFAVAFVVGGFVVLDAATRQARLSPSEVNLPLAVLGVGMIAAGAVVYAFATRFRAEGMGKPKDDSDEQSDNG